MKIRQLADFVRRAIGLVLLCTPLLWASDARAQQFELDDITGMDFSRIPGGCYLMGADPGMPGEAQRPASVDAPPHEVCVDSFWLARAEVTEAVWAKWMPDFPHREPADFPVRGVTLEEVELFLRRLNNRAAGSNFRLPTEAEWEFACRGGEPHSVNHDLSDMTKFRAKANFLDNRRYKGAPAAVGTLAANGYGLFDMLGNVWEWTADDYAADAYTRHVRQNPLHVEATGKRVMRGASYRSSVSVVRCGNRGWGVIGDRLETVGFRLVRSDPGRR